MRKHSQVLVTTRAQLCPRISSLAASEAKPEAQTSLGAPHHGGQQLELALQWSKGLHFVQRRHPAYLGHGQSASTR